MMKLLSISALTSLAAIALASPALAATGSVRISDLDLTSTDGNAELAKRIEKAANQICTINRETGTIITRSAPSKACLTDARQQISAQVQAMAARLTASSNQLARK